MKDLENQKVDMVSVAIFFASYVRELLKEIPDERLKETIIRIMLD